jgi:sulfide:quinone oxidoreductase
VATIYNSAGAYKTSMLRESFKGGKAVFTIPPFPIKCGGAPVKILFLSEETFRRNGVRDKTDLHFYAATPVFFPPVKEYNEEITKTALSKGVKPHFKHILTKIDKDNRVATFKTDDGNVDVNFDFLHFVPAQTAPEFIRTSEIAAANGWVDVNKDTL